VKLSFISTAILSGIVLFSSAAAYAQEPVAAVEAPKDWSILSSHESKLAAQVPNCEVIGRENIVLLWNRNLKPSYYAESQVANREQLADWIERAYCALRDVTYHDPNAFHQLKTGERHRLAIVWNGRKNYHFGGQKRPYIGASEGVGSSAWFHYICHELGHDFFHVHPEFKDKIKGWVEGMAEYMHFYLLEEMGMPVAARRFEEKMVASYRIDPFSRYRGRAYQFVRKQRNNNWQSPKELLKALSGKDVYIFMNGSKPVPVYTPNEIKESLVTVWDFEGGNGLNDKAIYGQAQDNLTILGGAVVRDGKAFIPVSAGAGLRANSSVDLEQTGEMTIWTRFRVPTKDAKKVSIVCLVDKRNFTTPESRSYALFLTPSDVNNVWGVGGQVSADGTRDKDVLFTSGIAAVEADQWNEAELVVRRVGQSLNVSWLASAGEFGGEWDFIPTNGPAKLPGGSIFRSNQPLIIGNDISLKAKTAAIEFDEIRLYNRALSGEDLLAIRPGELSRPIRDNQDMEELE
jgi:hypothetical protein